MNKKLIVSLVVLAGLAAATYFFIFAPKKAEAPVENQQAQTAPTAQPVTAEPLTAGEYKDYSERVVNATQGTKLLFFHAPWCPQCRTLDVSIQKGVVPDGVTIFKVDYDSNQALRKKYGVTIQTTIVKIDDNGDLIEKYVAYDEPNLESIVKNLL